MDTGSDQSGVPAYFLTLFPDSFCGFCLSLLLPVRCRCCDLLICICIQAFLLTAFFISASEASRDKCVYPRPVRHGAVGWTRHMREPPARGRPFIRSNSSRSSAQLTMVKAAILQVRYCHSHCLLRLSHCLHLEQGSNHEVSARLPHVQGTGRSNTDFAVHRFTLCADSDQFNSLSRSSDTCIDMSWTDKAAFLRHRSCVNQLLNRACPCSCLLLFPPLSFQPSLSLARWLDTSSMT